MEFQVPSTEYTGEARNSVLSGSDKLCQVCATLLIWKFGSGRGRGRRRFFGGRAEGQFARDQRLVVQINDSTESVMANIAEGFGRGTQEEFVVFLGYALGSLLETQSHLCAAYDRRYLTKEDRSGRKDLILNLFFLYIDLFFLKYHLSFYP